MKEQRKDADELAETQTVSKLEIPDVETDDTRTMRSLSVQQVEELLKRQKPKD